MSTPPVAEEISALRKATIEQVLAEGYAPHRVSGGLGSSVRAAASRLQIPDASLCSWLRRQEHLASEGQPNWLPDWSLWNRDSKMPKPASVEARAPARRFIFTAAQDDTPVHEAFWRNLKVYADHLGAELRVGGFTYQKGLYEDHASRTAVYAEAVQPFMCYEHLDLGPISFYGEMNILPTAVRPLSGLETYGGAKWAIFPHAKIQLISVPTLVGQPAKIAVTTGACTQPNYIAKKAGLKAQFHHISGAAIVEIDPAGRPFVRQISATDDGTFQDLDVIVKNGRVTSGHRVEAITWGDIHREKIDPNVALGAWGLDVASDQVLTHDTMLDVLRPRYQFFHDLLDFDARNHHRLKDHHHRFAMVCNGTDLVRDGVSACVSFLRRTERDWCRSVVIQSNHDDALLRWLKEADYREDVANAPFFLRCQAAVYDAINANDKEFNIFRHAMAQMDEHELAGIDFVGEDSSFTICQAAGGIECGLHGHLGPNGARGSALNLNRTATRMNIGHMHSAQILDGVYVAGLSGLMEQGYNHGPSSWSHSHIVTYPNSRRSILTMHGSKWRA
jgi:hypothetical protein